MAQDNTIRLAGNVGRTEKIWTDGDRRDGVVEVIELVGEYSGTLTRDNAGWTYHDADFDRVVVAVREGESPDWSTGSVTVDEEVRA